MKPSIGRIVHWNEEDGTIRPALILAVKQIRDALDWRETVATPLDENDFEVMLEVHGFAKLPFESNKLLSATQIIERAPYSPARSGHESARGCWTWPPRDT